MLIVPCLSASPSILIVREKVRTIVSIHHIAAVLMSYRRVYGRTKFPFTSPLYITCELILMSTFERKQKAIDRDEVWPNGISAILHRLYTFVRLSLLTGSNRGIYSI